jgi:hypothetical protein
VVYFKREMSDIGSWIKQGNLRRSRCGNSRFALEDDDAVCKVCGHDEVVLDDEGGLFSMEDESEYIYLACIERRGLRWLQTV